jgi:hypothetical protein
VRFAPVQLCEEWPEEGTFRFSSLSGPRHRVNSSGKTLPELNTLPF